MKPSLSVVDSQLPDPPYPADTITKGFRFELDMPRITRSDTWVLSPPDMRGNLLLLWATAFEQMPAGSMPSDHALIAAHIGMDARVFETNSDILLRGFVLHSDGRLYHHAVVDRVNKLLDLRENERVRKAKYREKMSHGTDVGLRGEGRGKDATGTGTGTGTSTSTGTSTGTSEDKKDKKEKRRRGISTEKAPSEPKKQTARAARQAHEFLPVDWEAWAKTNTPHLDPQQTWSVFKDYWAGVGGERGRKLDWFATWRNWCRRDAEKKPRGRVNDSRPAGSFLDDGNVIEGQCEVMRG